jgi:hypothetical protein
MIKLVLVIKFFIKYVALIFHLLSNYPLKVNALFTLFSESIIKLGYFFLSVKNFHI